MRWLGQARRLLSYLERKVGGPDVYQQPELVAQAFSKLTGDHT